MVLVGGYWFWFFIRVDVAAEGHSPFRVVKADLFVLSLLASVTLGVIWAAMGGGVGVLFWLYILATSVLFVGVPWSKFAHMFFKPAAAFEKRVSRANGTAENLPPQTRDDPEQQKAALHGAAARRSDGHGTRHQARSAPPLLKRKQTATSSRTAQGADSCLPSST